LLVYLGVALLLAGMLTTITSSSGTGVNGISLVFGVIMASMGLVLSFAALKADDGEQRGDMAVTYPLSHAESELASYQEETKKRSGNRAIVFVLVSLGLFVLTVFLAGFFFMYPLAALGVYGTIGGVILCVKKWSDFCQ
jgi:hypothetical protein